MPTRTLILLLATLGVFAIIFTSIVITIVLTGNSAAKKADKELQDKLDKADESKNKED